MTAGVGTWNCTLSCAASTTANVIILNNTYAHLLVGALKEAGKPRELEMLQQYPY